LGVWQPFRVCIFNHPPGTILKTKTDVEENPTKLVDHLPRDSAWLFHIELLVYLRVIVIDSQ
jgi:hypothetical protein